MTCVLRTQPLDRRGSRRAASVSRLVGHGGPLRPRRRGPRRRSACSPTSASPTPSDRGAIMGLYSIFLGLGQIVGSVASGAAAEAGRASTGCWRRPWSCFSLAIVPLRWLRESEHLVGMRAVPAEGERGRRLRRSFLSGPYTIESVESESLSLSVTRSSPIALTSTRSFFLVRCARRSRACRRRRLDALQVEHLTYLREPEASAAVLVANGPPHRPDRCTPARHVGLSLAPRQGPVHRACRSDGRRRAPGHRWRAVDDGGGDCASSALAQLGHHLRADALQPRVSAPRGR